eukprot:1308237-Alexandrium_andersonii.AAC.1
MVLRCAKLGEYDHVGASGAVQVNGVHRPCLKVSPPRASSSNGRHTAAARSRHAKAIRPMPVDRQLPGGARRTSAEWLHPLLLVQRFTAQAFVTICRMRTWALPPR